MADALGKNEPLNEANLRRAYTDPISRLEKELGLVPPEDGTPPPRSTKFRAVVTDKGPKDEADFDNAMYWVRAIAPAGTDEETKLPKTALETIPGADLWVKATHLGDVTADKDSGALTSAGRSLNVGDVVEVEMWHRNTNPPQFHYVIQAMSPMTTIRIDSNRTGNAWYRGYIWNRPTAPANTAMSALEGAAGTQGIEVSILNLQELGGASETGHDLTHADNTLQRLFRGVFVGQVDESKRPVVHINGAWFDSCA